MFSRLRNRILLLNVIMTTVLMAVSITAIYLLTGIETENLQKISILAASSTRNRLAQASVDSFSEAELLTFSFVISSEGKVLSVDSPFRLSSDECLDAFARSEAAMQSNLPSIELQGRTWLYVYGAPSPLDNRRIITFMDVTGSNRIIRMLKIITIVVALFLLLVITGLSFLFAGRTAQSVSDAWKRQQQFIADASHELKTPLAVIQANYDVILSNPDETVREQLKWLEYMKAGMDRMSLLVKDMLALATLESDSVIVRKASFDMSERLLKVIRTMKASADEKLIEVTERIEPNVVINSDSEIVARVFTTFYENAIKYTPPCGHIQLSLWDTKKCVSCSVSNTGDGIAAKDLQNIFDRFYRTDPVRNSQFGGFGLGLTIAKKNLDLIGGKVSVTSADHLTTFTFMISH
ncbi:MAG: HAMP domain-containing histidine kinase [Clostridiales bacterium]|jgi:signal transduction histidine kinase|nr:HAMP domain-containing histidine kinase [Clostridiales bacterium]